MAAQLTGPKPAFDGVAIRCTAADIPKYRGRYVTLIVDIKGLNEETFVLSGICPFTNATINIVGFNNRTNVTTNSEITCYVDNQNGVLAYEHHATLDDELDLKSYQQLMSHQQKNSAIFGF
eukprot:GILI01032524.1.p1 GENE.GILI01032524.1~~GILI01032524.1.p1  ORF type:complete len:121 (+),score=31.54 GILI01032524.1:50-412(+)